MQRGRHRRRPAWSTVLLQLGRCWRRGTSSLCHSLRRRVTAGRVCETCLWSPRTQMGSRSWQAGKSQWPALKSSRPLRRCHEEALPERAVGSGDPALTVWLSDPLPGTGGLHRGCGGPAEPFPGPGSAGVGTARGSSRAGRAGPGPSPWDSGPWGSASVLRWVWAEHAQVSLLALGGARLRLAVGRVRARHRITE